MLATRGFTLTVAELAFVYHYGRETSGAGRGPAVAWLVEHNLPGRAMTSFQYWGERNDDDSISKSLFEPLPPFGIPWASPEEFIARVHEIMEIYPQLKE